MTPTRCAMSCLLLLWLVPVDAQQDLLAPVREAYSRLSSYADEGTVVVESQSPGGPLLREAHKFRTLYKAPDKWLFEFTEDEASGGDRVAVWSGGDAFRTWWSATGVADEYSRDRAISAFGVVVFPTSGAAAHVASLVMPKVEIQSVFAQAKHLAAAGFEDIDGRRCRKFTGVAAGHFGAARPVTIWIDADTHMVRRIVEDTPQGAPAGTVDRLTTTFEPRANAALTDQQFTFTPPR